MKPGDEILIRAKLLNVRESDNEVTVGFDSTTTAVVPLGVVEGQGDGACEYCNALWERRGRWHRHPEGTTFAYECAATIEEYEILHRCDHGAIVRKLAAGTEGVEQDDPVKCGCDEYPECTHVLYWYQGFKAGRAAALKERT